MAIAKWPGLLIAQNARRIPRICHSPANDTNTHPDAYHGLPNQRGPLAKKGSWSSEEDKKAGIQKRIPA